MRGLRRNMAKLYDQICRILATPMPRSRALKLIFGGLAGAVLAPFGFGQNPCPPGWLLCGQGQTTNCCPPQEKCCSTGNNPHCCPGTHTCCGNTCCPPEASCNG